MNNRNPRTRETTKEPSRKKPVVASMNDALLGEINEIRQLSAHVEKNDAVARYPIAKRCLRVKEGEGEGNTYGTAAMSKLAAALGWSKSNAYTYAAVAVTWPTEEQFAAIVTRKNQDGWTLTWSHAMVIAQITDVERRDMLISAALEGSWSVERLKRESRLTRPDDTAEAGDDAMPKGPRHLVAATQNYAGQINIFASNASTFASALEKAIDDADLTDVPKDTLDKLKQARQELEESYQRNVRLLDAWITKLDVSMKSSTSPSRAPTHNEIEQLGFSTRVERVLAIARMPAAKEG